MSMTRPVRKSVTVPSDVPDGVALVRFPEGELLFAVEGHQLTDVVDVVDAGARP